MYIYIYIFVCFSSSSRRSLPPGVFAWTLRTLLGNGVEPWYKELDEYVYIYIYREI